MDGITKPSITRVARIAGVKSVADDCYDVVRDILNQELTEIARMALVANSARNVKTLMVEDVYEALNLLGYNVAYSSDLGAQTCAK